MSDVFLTKKERLSIVLQSIIYILAIVLASYFTICGDIFIRMIPLMYFLGIIGKMLFEKAIITTIFGSITTFIIGCYVKGGIDSSVLIYTVYTALMIICGEIVGYILMELYDNSRYKKFIKYYKKIQMIIMLIILLIVPIYLNNVVNSNIVSYTKAKFKVKTYIIKNYEYSSEHEIISSEYKAFKSSGVFSFDVLFGETIVNLEYSKKLGVIDANMEARKASLDKLLNVDLYSIYHNENLNMTATYDYSNVSILPDIIKIKIQILDEKDIDNVISAIDSIKNSEYKDMVERIDISIGEKAFSINKENLNNKQITKEYVINGTSQEFLDEKGV